MRRAVLLGSSVISALALSGCPIYPEEPYACSTSADCAYGELCDPYEGVCYVPPPGTGGGSGSGCNEPSDCGPNETCSSKGQCRIGDCTFHGCVSGWECSSSTGVWTCVKSGSGGVGGSAGGSAGSAGEAGAGSAGTAGSAGAAGSAGEAGGGGAAGAGTAGSAGTASAGAAGEPGVGGSAGEAGSGSAGAAPDAGSEDASSD